MLKFNLRSFCAFAILSFLLLSGSSIAQSNTNNGVPNVQFADIGAPKAGNPNDVNNVSFSQGIPTDVSIGLLQKILGNWHDSTPDPVMGPLFKSLNLGILAFGAIFFIYVSAAGILHSAEDGELLGKKWGSAFVPIRMSIGFAAIFPLANGYSLVQLVVLWLATNGVGFANWVTNQTLASFTQSQGMVITNQLIDDQALSITMTQIVKAETCAAEINYKFNEPGQNIKYVGLAGANIITGGSNNSYGKAVWGINPTYAGDPRLSNLPADVCGSIEISNFNSFLGMGDSAGLASDLTSNLTSGISSGWKGSQLNDLNTSLRTAHFEAILRAAYTLRPYAESFVSSSNTNAAAGNSTGIAVQVIKAAQEYRANIANKVQSGGSLPATEDMTNAMLTGINQSGWSTLGSWYYQFARVNSVLSKLTSYAPTYQPSKSRMDPAVADMMAAVDAAVAQNATSPATVSQIKDLAGNYTAGTAYGGLYGGSISLSNRASNNSAQFLATTFGVDPENKVNALIQLKDVGDYIIGTAETIYVAKKAVDVAMAAKNETPVGVAVSAVSAVVSSVMSSPKVKFLRMIFGGVGDDASDVMKYVFLFAAISMLGFAMTLAFWIPMSPFILWIGGFLGWVIAVLEMVAAAPLWAAAHLHPDGEGMASKYGANGWMIILEVFAKPVLMVVGFFVASRVLDPFLRFSSQLFFNNMTTVNGDSLTGIVTTVAFVFMYVGFCLVMVHRCLSFIHIIPSSILRWVGSNGDHFSQSEKMAGDMEAKISNYFIAAQKPLNKSTTVRASNTIESSNNERNNR